MRKTKFQIKKVWFTTIIILIVMNCNAFAQGNNFKLNGNNNLEDSVTFIGSTNAKDFVVKTDATERLRINKFGNTTFKKYVLIQDSMRVLGRLAIGNKTLYLDPASSFLGNPNSIYSTNSDLFIQSDPATLNYNTILNANGNTGKVGIGTTNPQSQLHINDGTYATFQMTNTTTGANVNDGFKLAVNNQNQALMAQYEESPIRFLVNDNAPGNILTKERMRITTAMVSQHGNPPAPVTRVSIPNKGYAPITNPVSLLHMGEPAGLGYRSWMDVGTFIGYHTDNMYVGLFDRDPYIVNQDITDAVINWGDDYDYTQPIPNTGPDDLLFIFTDNYSSTVPSTDDKNPHSAIGAEVARMSFRGFFGSMGICTPNPKARLHVTASNPDQVLANAPDHRLQMRLSFDIRSNTDFRVLEKNSSYPNYGGNLLIIPWYNELVGPGSQDQARNVGIGLGFHTGSITHYPKRRLDVWDDTDPQLRLSCILDNDPTVGIYTDIQTTNTNNNYNAWSLWTGGHLLINPRNNGKKGTVAIDMEDINTPANPGLALDVNGQQNIRTVNQDDGIDKILVWDDSNTNNGHGRVMWRDASTLGGGGADADWYDPLTGTAPTNINSDIYTNGNISVDVTSATLEKINVKNLDKQFGFYMYQQGLNGNNPTGIVSEVHASSGTVDDYVVGIKGGGLGNGSTSNQTPKAFGVVGIAKWAKINYGIYGQAPSGSYAGYFAGQVIANAPNLTTSDIIFKENISTITNSLEIIDQLNPVKFNFKNSQYEYMGFPIGQQYGLIAQEVQNILPELVDTVVQPAQYDSLNNVISPEITFKTLKYQEFIPFLIKGMQEQQTQIDSMQQVINSIVTQLASCCDTMMNKIGVNAETGNSINVELASKGAILYQNTPNPFGEGTAIRYFIPDGVNDARIVFYDEYGSEIKNVPISDIGNGQLNIGSMNLASGLYTYSLIVNNKIVDTKKMIRTKK